MRRLADVIARLAGVHTPADLDLRAMFAQVMRRHPDEEVEQVLAAGLPQTTPDSRHVDPRGPHPWVFMRILLLMLGMYGLLLLAWEQSGNRNLVPGLIAAGSCAVPAGTLLLLFECNARRNVSLFQLARLGLLGGVLAVLAALFLYRLSDMLQLQWVGGPLAALVEEPAKLLALVLVAGNPRWRHPFNGLLFGAAVGAGFAAFESAGFAFRAGLEAGASAMRHVILVRGVLAPFNHVIWTALPAAALWRAGAGQRLVPAVLWDAGFLRLLVVAILLHMAWDAAPAWPLHAFQVLPGVVGWVVAAGFLQEDLLQLRHGPGAPP